MFEFLQNWKGSFEIDTSIYANYNSLPSDLDTSKGISITLKPVTVTANEVNATEQHSNPSEPLHMNADVQYRIKVKQYMTKKATADFDFMQKWNNDNPMPLRVMVGTKVKETRGMVYMILHGDILQEKTMHCMKCGKMISNPVSQFFGLGPECGGHNYVNPFESEDELKSAVESYRKKLNNIVWEGWIIKSAIEDMQAL